MATEEEIEDLKKQVRGMSIVLGDTKRQLDAVQDLAMTTASFARLLDKMVEDHIAEAKATIKPKSGPEVA